MWKWQSDLPWPDVCCFHLSFQKHKEVGQVRKAYWCVREWMRPEVGMAFDVYMFVFLFLLPVSIMAAAYTGIARALWRGSALRRSMTVPSWVPIHFRDICGWLHLFTTLLIYLSIFFLSLLLIHSSLSLTLYWFFIYFFTFFLFFSWHIFIHFFLSLVLPWSPSLSCIFVFLFVLHSIFVSWCSLFVASLPSPVCHPIKQSDP